MYPEVVEITPGTVSMASSVHQKQPAAKVAFASPVGWLWEKTGIAAMVASQIGRMRRRANMICASFGCVARLVAVKTGRLHFSSAGTASTANRGPRRD